MGLRQKEPQKNTLRFVWKKTDAPIMQRKLFGKEVLLDCLKLKVEEVFCLQENPLEKAWEVTFQTSDLTERMFGQCQRRGGEEPLSFFDIEDLHRMDERLITVHMFNPHVPEKDIIKFLESYGEMLAPPVKQKDSLGFWTGRTLFSVKLKTDENGYDCLAHPPALFSIGADRGYCFYARQPPFCKKCRGRGHKEANCNVAKKCRFCLSAEHLAADCTRPKACHTCGSTDHLRKDCPERGGAVGGGPKGAETERDNGALISRPGEGESKKRPPPSGEKAAPAKASKVEPVPFSLATERDRNRPPEVGENGQVPVISVSSSSSEASPGVSTVSSGSGMDTSGASETEPSAVTEMTKRAKGDTMCRWCKSTEHKEMDCTLVACRGKECRDTTGHWVKNCPWRNHPRAARFVGSVYHKVGTDSEGRDITEKREICCWEIPTDEEMVLFELEKKKKKGNK